MKYKTKNLLKKVITGVLAVGVVAGATAGVVSLARHAKEDLREINPTFKVGGLNEQGKYVESDESIYTKDAFECRGLDISLDFENNIKYQIFYYESDGDFVEATNVLEGNYTANELSYNITHARIEITPEWDEDVEEEDRICKWSNKREFSKQMTIKVAKEQDIDFNNMQNYLNITENQRWNTEGSFIPTNDDNYSFIELNSSLYSDYVISYKVSVTDEWLEDDNCTIFWYYTAEGSAVNSVVDKSLFENNSIKLGIEYLQAENSKVYITFSNSGKVPQISFVLN